MGRLLDIDSVIRTVDRHTKEDNSLDNDISCILEEVPTAFDKEEFIDLLKRKAQYFHDCNSECFNAMVDVIFILERQS